MNRLEALRTVARVDGLIVCNLAYPSRELYRVADDARNFYMLGSMGLASSIGLGLALAQRRRVIAIDGDGSVLMNLGSLSTIAHFGPSHFVLVVLDNGAHGSTGNQPTHTALGTDIAGIARSCGIRAVSVVSTVRQLLAAVSSRGPGPRVVVARVNPGNADVSVIPMRAKEIRDRFVRAARSA